MSVLVIFFGVKPINVGLSARRVAVGSIESCVLGISFKQVLAALSCMISGSYGYGQCWSASVAGLLSGFFPVEECAYDSYGAYCSAYV